MPQQPLSIAELQEIARRYFGREVSPEEAEAARVRLTLAPRNLDLLARWQGELRDLAPWLPVQGGGGERPVADG